MHTLLVASVWIATNLVAQGPVNDDCADALSPPECVNLAANPNLGLCNPSGQTGASFEFCDVTVGTAPQHDCMLPGATCVAVIGYDPFYRCAFLTDNTGATMDGPNTTETSCSASGIDSFGADVWYQIVAPDMGTLALHNCADSDYDSMIQVFSNHTPTCPSCPITDNSLDIGCNDEGCAGGTGGSGLTVSVQESVCYLIRVGGRDLPGGANDPDQGTSMLELEFFGDDGLHCDCFPLPPDGSQFQHARPKNRYISFIPNRPDTAAFRVVKTTAPGGSCWVQTPVQSGPAQYTAKCDAVPVFRVWTEPVVHVGDCEIVPVATYTIFLNHPGPIEIPLGLSVQTSPLPALNGKLWGDAVGVNNGLEWTPPNQFTNVQDVLAILSYITNAAIQPHFTVANLQSISAPDSCLNAFINTADVLISVRAISGDSYGPPSTGKILDPAMCPVCP